MLENIVINIIVFFMVCAIDSLNRFLSFLFYKQKVYILIQKKPTTLHRVLDVSVDIC